MIGEVFRASVRAEHPLQIPGVVNAYAALLARRAGYRALYLSGAGVANHSLGQPDVGRTELADVVIDARRITSRVDLPLLVDIDTGWDDPMRAVRLLGEVGVAAVHLEDQVCAKICGHLPGKRLVGVPEMVARIRAAVAGKPHPSFVVMARTDAAATEGLEAAIARARAYVHAGADMIFAEALSQLDDYRDFAHAVGVPVLANLTEFGRTPLMTTVQLGSAGVAIVLYPLGASRMAAAASLEFYETVRRDGTQQALVAKMQHRKDLYATLEYVPPVNGG